MKRTLSTAFVCLLASPCFADTGVLVEHVPNGATRAVVVAMVKQVLLHRRWTVEAVDENSVSASINGNSTAAKLRVSIVDQSLVYEGSARQQTPSVPSQAPTSRGVDIPKRWIQNLRMDLGDMFATVPDTPKQ